MRRELVVDAPGLRLDRFLADRFPGYSRVHLRGMIERGLVTVDGARADASRRLKAEELVAIFFEQAGWADEQPFEDWVLHEDSELLVLDKPAGLLMHPLGGSWLKTPAAALAEREPNLAGLLLRRRPKIAAAGISRCGIVHRLDRQTSGVLLVAKTPRAERALLEDFKERRVSKVYRAVVRGAPAERSSRVEAPVGRPPGRRRVIVTPLGRAAETAFRVLRRAPDAALVEARPLSGRTHQIRAHLAELGHPVAGDPDFDRGTPPAPRLMLHAWRVEFDHPDGSGPVAFSAPEPADFKAFWRALGGRRKS